MLGGALDIQSQKLVGLFYEAVGDASAWSAAVAGLSVAFRSDHGFLTTERAAPARKPFNQATGLSDTDLARFSSERAADLWTPYIACMPVDRPFLQAEVVPQDDFERSDFYNEIVRPTGGLHSINFRAGRGEHWAMTLCRSRRTGAFDQRDKDRLSRLAPNLNAAFVLHRRLAAVEHRSAGLASALDRIEDGALLLHSSGKLTFANARAQDLLGDPDQWVETARLQLHPGSADFLRVADVVGDIAAAPPNGEHRYYCRLASGDLLVVDARRAADLAAAADALPRASTILFLSAPRAERSIDRAALEHVMGLTRRESEIAAEFAAGRDTAMIAATTGLTVSTVRYYLKTISAKVGVRSQAALVATLQVYRRPR